MDIKKIFLSIIGIFLISLTFIGEGRAQSIDAVGIRGGINFATLNNSSFDSGAYTGLTAGLYTHIKINSSPISLQPEILYTQKGFKSTTDSYRIDYIEVPVPARLNLSVFKKLGTFVDLGPYISFKVNSNVPDQVVYYHPTQSTDSRQNNFYEGDINPTDYGLILGGGINLGRFEMSIRYDASLHNISDDENVDAKNSTLSLVAGIKF